MKTVARVTRRICAISLVSALAACTLPAVQPQGTPPTQAALDALQRVRDQYQAGHYGEVIRGVATSADLAGAPTAIQVEAIKLQAFSYCVSNYRKLCEDSFLRILQIDPSFELAPNEQGHPQWGPVFRSAKAAMTPAR
ncbi:TssQ family T6SS-associated lipoprotein [Achromobacter aloeverae]|uniref:Lipoprotein n=1 Tax=Achromobacter aloeverae TaxID=1750518 RepID=A0A4Q1HJA1_9BURK|nr:TssQ family T6SS-associated lipoprotein [Achromobacter aloeverae]RXN87014.1 hypothetical protein C7R54_17205 [Achromobacter aloeverae]